MVSNFKWGNRFYKPPKSLCSKQECATGYGTEIDIITNTETKKLYAWTCKVCPQNFFKSSYGSGECNQCKNITVPNNAKTYCIDPYKITFLRFSSAPGYVTIALSIVGLTYSVVIIGTFIKFRSTPVVRCFNLPLSILQLIAHLLLFLIIPLVFTEKPSNIKCLIRNGLVGLLMVIICSITFVKVQKLVFIFKCKVVITGSQRNVATAVDIFTIVIMLLVVFALEAVTWKQYDLISIIIDKKEMKRNIYCTSETNLHVHTIYIIIISVCCAIQALRASSTFSS